jgi:long-chain acyl-CoA synthetase
MMGYYKRPDLTAEAIQEGWLHTGDIGSLEEGRFLRLTDRKKELFKTSGGKYVAPSPIENRLTEHPLVEQVLVTGEGRKFVSAFIVPSFSHLESWFRTQRKSYPGPDHAVRDPDVQQLFRQLVDAANSFSGQVEQVKKFTLLPRSWTVESGELTPTLKPRRRVILGRLQQALEAMYD